MSGHRSRGIGFAFGFVVAAWGLSACGVQPSPEASALADRDLRYGPNDTGPDRGMTPGDLCNESNADFDGYRYGANHVPHCRRDVSTSEKVAIAASYGIRGDSRRDYEIDHYIPLNIGGSNDQRNLWPLIAPLAREKSVYEQYLMNEVAAQHLTQSAAIAAIKAWRPGMTW